MQENKSISPQSKPQKKESRLRILSCLSFLLAITIVNSMPAYPFAGRYYDEKTKTITVKKGTRQPSRGTPTISAMAPSSGTTSKSRGRYQEERSKPWRGSISLEEAQSVGPQTEIQPDKSFTVNFSELPSQKKSIQEVTIVPAPMSVSDVQGKANEEIKLEVTPPDEAQPPLIPRPFKSGASSTSQGDLILAAPPTQVVKAMESDGFIPPDTQGAVGPNHLLSAANGTVRVQTRSGITLRTTSLQQFVNEPDAFDPRVMYDRFNNRWILVALARRESADARIMFCWSQTSDPTGNWEVFFYDVDSTNQVWADFPRIGITQDRIIVTWTAFPIFSGDLRQRIWVWSSAGVYSKTDLGARGWTDTVGTNLVPAYSQDVTSDLWLVCNWNHNFEGSGFLRIGKISGPINDMRYTDRVSFARSFIWNPIDSRANFAPQLGTTTRINIGDDNVASVVYRNGQLWCAQPVLSTLSQPTSGIYFWQISPATGAVAFSRLIFGLDFWQSHPSIAVNRNNDVLIGASIFTTTSFASGVYWQKTAGRDFEGQIFVAGESPYATFDGIGRNRWGDYSSTLVDPVDDTSFWTIQQYAETPGTQSRWGIAWAKVGGIREDGGGNTPIAPSNLTATEINSNDLVLRWNDNSNNESAFGLEFLDGTTWREFGTTNPNVTSVKVTGLLPNTTYNFRVRAYNNTTPSAYSNEVTARTAAAISAPIGLRIKKVKKNGMTLTWQDTATNESRYEVLQRVGTTFTVIGSIGANASSVKINGLQPRTLYTFAVRACNSSGCSGQAEVSGNTK